MTYHPSGNSNGNGNGPILVARRGYGDLGADPFGFASSTSNPAWATAYCQSKYGTGGDYAPCVNWYLTGNLTEYKPAGGGTLASIGGGVKDILLGGLSAYAASKGASNMPYMYPPPPNPLMMPLLLGGGVLVMVLLLRRPRRGGGGAPVSNPSRRRRRRRNGRRTHRRTRRTHRR